MAQNIFDSINPAVVSGTQLATILNDFKDAIVTGFSGTTRPTNLQANGYWIDETNSPTLDFKFFDGTDDITLFQINTATNAIILTATDSEFAINKTSDDAIGALLTLSKARVTGTNGQVLTNDVIGQTNYQSSASDGTTPPTVKQIAVATEDHTAIAQGTSLLWQIVKAGSASLTEALRLLNGRMGVNTTGANVDSDLHVVGNTGIRHEIQEDSVTGSKVIQKKERIAGSGQVLSGDNISESISISTDEGGAEITAAQVIVAALEDHSTAAQGTSYKIQTKEVGSTSLLDRLFFGDGVAEIYDSQVTIHKGRSLASATTNGAGIRFNFSDNTDFLFVYDNALNSKIKMGFEGAEQEVPTLDSTGTFTNKDISASSNNISGIADAEIQALANISLNKLAPVSGDRALISDSEGYITASGILSAELAYLSGLTSNVQGQIDLKANIADTVALTGIQTVNGIKTFTGTAKFDDVIEIQEQNTVSTPDAGRQAIYPKTDGKWYTQNDAGVETEVGSGASGGSGGIDYIGSDFEDETVDGWTEYFDGVSDTPVDGTGDIGNSSHTASNVATTTLRGDRALQIVTGGGQGSGTAKEFTIDPADKNQPLYLSLDYSITSGTYTAGDLGFFIYDITNTQIINFSTVGDFKSTGVGRITGVFYASDSVSYRLILHNVATPSITIELDNVSVGPQKLIDAPIVSDWEGFTPTGSWTGAVTYTGQYRRVGDSAEIVYKVAASGAPTGATLIFDPPPGLSWDASKINANSTNGSAYILDSGAREYVGGIRWDGTPSLIVTHTESSGAGIVNITNPFTFGSGDIVSVHVTAPIAEWANSSAVLSTNAMLNETSKVRAYDENTETSVSNNSWTTIGFDTAQFSEGGAFTIDTANDRITFNQDIYARVNASIAWNTNTTGDRTAAINLNGTGRIAEAYSRAAGSIFTIVKVATARQFLKGEFVQLEGFQNSGGNLSTVGYAAGTYIEVETQPRATTYGVYGQYEVLSAAMTTLTPGAAGVFYQTNAPLALSAGTWEIDGIYEFGQGGGTSATFSYVYARFYSEDGDNTGSGPANVLSDPNVTEVFNDVQVQYQEADTFTIYYAPMNKMIVTCSGPVNIYAVPYASIGGTIGDARVRTRMVAKRLR